ncbi:MAG: DoxX family protein [bacterium]|nr:DoxX family protein [bacterium]
MLNTFPDLLTFSLFAPFILRVVLGVILIDLGILKFKSERSRWMASFEALRLRPAGNLVSLMGSIEIIGGIMLIVGIYTQIAALVFVVLFAIEFYIEWTEANVLKRDLVFYVLCFAISLSLLLSGAGAFAFDIPL